MSRRTCAISATEGLLTFVGRSKRSTVTGDPAYSVDVRDGADLAHDLLDVSQARGLEREPAQGCTVLYGIYPGREDTHACVRDGRGNVLEQVHPIQGLDEDLHSKETSFALCPLDLHEALRVACLQGPGVRASRSVHHNTAT